MSTLLPASLLAFLLLVPSTAPAQLVGGVWEQFQYTWTNEPTTLAALDDVDGDGWKDYAVGRYNNGAVDVRSGATGSLLYTLSPASSPRMFGQAICDPGDVDGDGIGDILVGAPLADAPLADQGAAFLFSGRDGTQLLEVHGVSTSDQLGNAVSPIGDLNGDGIPDLLVGAHRATFSGRGSTGAAYVFSGADGTMIRFWGGLQDGDAFGSTVLGPGDLDNDGMPDVVIGAQSASGSATHCGAVDAYSGATGILVFRREGALNDYFGKSLATNGDLSGDAVPDLFVAELPGVKVTLISGSNGAELFQIPAPTPGRNFGLHFGTGQDYDGDGFVDLAISAQGDSTVFISSGRDGLLFRATLSSLSPYFGQGLCAMEDISGDGRADLLVSDSATVRAYWFAPGLEAVPDTLSAASGGTTAFRIDFPPSEAGLQYILLGSLHGMGPTTLYGLDIPLTQDSLFTSMSQLQAPPYFSSEFGVLDLLGDATAYLTFTPGQASAFIGRRGFFSAVSYAPPSTPRIASVARIVTITP